MSARHFTPFLFSCLFLWAIPLWGASVSYRIEAEIDVDHYRITGKESLVFKNPTGKRLTEIYLFLYPNQFEHKNPKLNEINYRWHHPSGFDQGFLKVSSVQDVRTGEVLPVEFVEGTPFPQTILRVSLVKPLEAGGEVEWKIDFECKIPHKYGPFGHYRDTLTAQGGWHPYLAPFDSEGNPLFDALPAASSFRAQIRLSKQRDAVLNGKFFDDTSQIEFEEESARFLTLVVTPEFHLTRRQSKSRNVTFFSLSADRYRLSRIMDTLVQAVDDAVEFFGDSGLPQEVPVVETYLRAVMSFPGQNMILFSDRFFVTINKFDLLNLNKLEAARAVGHLAVDRTVAERESVSRYNWIGEALAWAFRNHYLRSHFKDLSNLRETAGRMGMFRPFNRMAASPTIPFSATYVENVVYRDDFRESLFYFNNQLPSGRLLAEKLKSTLGEEKFGQIVAAYFPHHSNLQAQAEQVTGEDLNSFFQQWELGYPADLDYQLADVQRNHKVGGNYLTEFTVKKDGAAGFVEPLEVLAQKEGGENELLHWDGSGPQKKFEIQSDKKVEKIQIDPRFKTVELTDSNNLAPLSWEMVMDRGNVDVGSAGLGLGMRMRMHKVKDFNKWMFVNPFFSTAVYGFESGMIFNFGEMPEGLVFKRRHEMSISYSLTGLRSDFADRRSGRVDGDGKTAALKFSYSWDTELFEEDSMDFERVDFSAALYREELGSDFNFFQSAVEVRKVFSPHPKHRLGGRLTLAYSDGIRSQDEIPAQNLFDLSSATGLGIVDSGRHLGENALGATFEWRHDLMSDMEMKMPMNNWIRRLQGVLAVEAGWVARRFDELFRLDRAVYGIRYGLNFHYDFLGVRPSDFYVHVGHRVGVPSGDGTVLTLGILQWF